MKKYSKNVDERGCLIAFDKLDDLKVKRFFLIECNKGFWRGKHYHKKTTQLICVLKGSLDAKAIDANGEMSFSLNEGSTYLQNPGTQFEFMSSANKSTILVLCDTEHDEEDYFTY